MPRGRKTRAAAPNRRPFWIILAVGSLALAGAAYYAASQAGERAPAAGALVTQWSDVHGLAIHPTSAREVFVATHHGLVRGVDDKDWSFVGDSRDDLMGFSMHPSNASVFWSSGHPASGGNLGVRLSEDGGVTWRFLALEGVDFHAMAVSPADPNVLWGYWRGALYGSQDGGREWSVVGDSAPQIRALTAHPTDAKTLFATTSAGVMMSTDAGASWRPLAALPAVGLAVDPSQSDVMFAGIDGGIHKSTDGGASWSNTGFDQPGAIAFLAVSPLDGNVVYAASYQTGIYKSTDAGATWRVVKPPV